MREKKKAIAPLLVRCASRAETFIYYQPPTCAPTQQETAGVGAVVRPPWPGGCINASTNDVHQWDIDLPVWEMDFPSYKIKHINEGKL